MTYYDHSKNQLNAGRSKAMHDNRKDAIREGRCYCVEFGWKSHGEAYWNGDAKDIMELAEELLWNGAYVRLFDPNGIEQKLV